LALAQGIPATVHEARESASREGHYEGLRDAKTGHSRLKSYEYYSTIENVLARSIGAIATLN
jgi:hypothetical protein